MDLKIYSLTFERGGNGDEETSKEAITKVQVREKDCSNQHTHNGKGVGARVRNNVFIYIRIRQKLNAGAHLYFIPCIPPLSKAFKLFNTDFLITLYAVQETPMAHKRTEAHSQYSILHCIVK